MSARSPMQPPAVSSPIVATTPVSATGYRYGMASASSSVLQVSGGGATLSDCAKVLYCDERGEARQRCAAGVGRSVKGSSAFAPHELAGRVLAVHELRHAV